MTVNNIDVIDEEVFLRQLQEIARVCQEPSQPIATGLRRPIPQFESRDGDLRFDLMSQYAWEADFAIDECKHRIEGSNYNVVIHILGSWAAHVNMMIDVRKVNGNELIQRHVTRFFNAANMVCDWSMLLPYPADSNWNLLRESIRKTFIRCRNLGVPFESAQG